MRPDEHAPVPEVVAYLRARRWRKELGGHVRTVLDDWERLAGSDPVNGHRGLCAPEQGEDAWHGRTWQVWCPVCKVGPLGGLSEMVARAWVSGHNTAISRRSDPDHEPGDPT